MADGGQYRYGQHDSNGGGCRVGDQIRVAAGEVQGFLDIANHYILAGAQYNPQILAGLSAAQIAGQLRNPSSPVAQAIDGSASIIVTAIDQVLHGAGTGGASHR